MTNSLQSRANALTQQLLNATGRTYRISPDIPPNYLIDEVFRRGIQLVRGLISRAWCLDR
jgi:hypothetical protein